MAFGMTACWWIAAAMRGRAILLQLAVAAVFAIALLAIEYPIFGLGQLRRRFASRFLRRRFQEELTPAA